MVDRKECPMRTELGNCMPVGGFCFNSISDEICEVVHSAYNRGFIDCEIKHQIIEKENTLKNELRRRCNMTYEEEMKISTDFFDTIDFKQFIKPGKRMELQDLEDSIEAYYKNHRKLLPEVFKGYVFNFVTDYEFGQYLEKRYGWEMYEEVIERHYFIPS